MNKIVEDFINQIAPWRCTFLLKFLISGLVSENKYVNRISEFLTKKSLTSFPKQVSWEILSEIEMKNKKSQAIHQIL